MPENKRTHRLLPVAELPVQPLVRTEIDGHGILLCRVNQELYAVDDRCPHEDISLSLGALCEYRLRCPLHGSEFDIRDGAVLNEPADSDLRHYPVSIDDGWVCIDRDVDA